jgi:hypothetical protein
MLIFARKNAIEATSVYAHSRFSASTVQAVGPPTIQDGFLFTFLR